MNRNGVFQTPQAGPAEATEAQRAVAAMAENFMLAVVLTKIDLIGRKRMYFLVNVDLSWNIWLWIEDWRCVRARDSNLYALSLEASTENLSIPLRHDIPITLSLSSSAKQ